MDRSIGLLGVRLVKNTIDNNTSIEDMGSDLQKLSEEIFGDSSSPLTDFVNNKLPDIVHYLEQDLTPEEVCDALML
ncbi:MAG: hypothetical protein DCF12_10050 [Snowella sp.]|jgi:hypothetical protein|nr:MAG: hypothetical protein DCF12_10050 [Snowella sp.]